MYGVMPYSSLFPASRDDDDRTCWGEFVWFQSFCQTTAFEDFPIVTYFYIIWRQK